MTKNDELFMQQGKLTHITATIEKLLIDKFNAKGKGLFELTNSVENQLPKHIVDSLHKIRKVRNSKSHNNNKLKDINPTIILLEKTIKDLKNIVKQRKIKQREIKQREIKQREIKQRENLIYSIPIITLIISIILWFFIPSYKQNNSNVKNISTLTELNKELDLVNSRINKLNLNLDIEIKEQGLLRDIFNDTDSVDNLENDLDSANIQKEQLIEKINKVNLIKLNKELNLVNSKINKMSLNLDAEIKKQSFLRDIFNDTDSVDSLEDDLDRLNIQKKQLIEKINISKE